MKFFGHKFGRSRGSISDGRELLSDDRSDDDDSSVNGDESAELQAARSDRQDPRGQSKIFLDSAKGTGRHVRSRERHYVIEDLDLSERDGLPICSEHSKNKRSLKKRVSEYFEFCVLFSCKVRERSILFRTEMSIRATINKIIYL